MPMKALLGFWGLIYTGLALSNPTHQQLTRMSEADRKVLFTKFFTNGGERCDVTKTFYQGSTKGGDAFWNVGCRGKDGFQILIYNDAKGSTKILECRIVKTVTGTPCFQKFNN
jgi:hypothetical protein